MELTAGAGTGGFTVRTGSVTALREPADSTTPAPETCGRAALTALPTGMVTGEQP